MPRKPGIPTYRRKGNRAVVTLVVAGDRRDFSLGTYGTAESKAEYARIVNEWQESHGRVADGIKSELTVNELILAFWRHVETHYRHPDGTQTSEVENFKCSLRPVRELYGYTLASKFGPLAMKAVRRVMIDAGLARGVINGRVSRIRLMFKWATAEEIIEPSVLQALKAVEGLQAGRSEAKDRPDVGPVADEHVDLALPHLSKTVAAMVQVQRLTGMRPGEVISIKRAEIDMSGDVWFYKPERHKNTWRGKSRVIGIGPKAQAILTDFFTFTIEDYLFSPIRAREEHFAELRARRKNPVQPSQMSRRKDEPERIPGDCYTGAAYTRAVRRACLKAGVPVWKPNQLRHAFATEIRKRFGLEAAQVGLGHAKADVTEVYAEANAAFVATIAVAVG
jgi:integrase